MHASGREEIEPGVHVVRRLEPCTLALEDAGLPHLLGEVGVLVGAVPDQVEALFLAVLGDQVGVVRVAAALQAGAATP